MDNIPDESTCASATMHTLFSTWLSLLCVVAVCLFILFSRSAYWCCLSTSFMRPSLHKICSYKFEAIPEDIARQLVILPGEHACTCLPCPGVSEGKKAPSLPNHRDTENAPRQIGATSDQICLGREAKLTRENARLRNEKAESVRFSSALLLFSKCFHKSRLLGTLDEALHIIWQTHTTQWQSFPELYMWYQRFRFPHLVFG